MATKRLAADANIGNIIERAEDIIRNSTDHESMNFELAVAVRLLAQRLNSVESFIRAQGYRGWMDHNTPPG